MTAPLHPTAWLPGLALAAAGAAAAWGVHRLVPAVPWLTAALVLGVIVGCLPPARTALDGVFRAGLALSSRRVLRIGIVLLGLDLSLRDIASLGWLSIVAIVGLVVVSFIVTWLIARLFRLEREESVLLAAGFSICGVSAVAAIAGARGIDERETGRPIALVTLYGTLAIVVLPVLSSLLGLDAVQFGRWVGASVHDVGQVVATAQTGGAAALAVALVVKLTRVLMLAPMVAVASLETRRRAGPSTGSGTDTVPELVEGRAPKLPPIVPLFIVGFVVAVLIRSFLPLPLEVFAVTDVVHDALLATALFAIGASLRLALRQAQEPKRRSGIRSILAGLVAWIAILGLGLAFVYLT